MTEQDWGTPCPTDESCRHRESLVGPVRSNWGFTASGREVVKMVEKLALGLGLGRV